MKNISVILNVVLGVAVAILFFLYFKGNSKTQTTKTDSTSTVSSTSQSLPAGSIAYVDLDSLEAKYTYFKEGKAKMDQAQTDLENNIASQGERLQAEYYALQQKAPTMTQAEGEAAQQSILTKKDNIEKYKESQLTQLQNNAVKFNNDLYAKIDTVLAEYNKDHKYAYILSYRKGTVILFKDKNLDVTKDVIEVLNKHEPAKAK